MLQEVIIPPLDEEDNYYLKNQFKIKLKHTS